MKTCSRCGSSAPTRERISVPGDRWCEVCWSEYYERKREELEGAMLSCMVALVDVIEGVEALIDDLQAEKR